MWQKMTKFCQKTRVYWPGIFLHHFVPFWNFSDICNFLRSFFLYRSVPCIGVRRWLKYGFTEKIGQKTTRDPPLRNIFSIFEIPMTDYPNSENFSVIGLIFKHGVFFVFLPVHYPKHRVLHTMWRNWLLPPYSYGVYCQYSIHPKTLPKNVKFDIFG